jgi:outer membrane lipoprotein-sorting protein
MRNIIAAILIPLLILTIAYGKSAAEKGLQIAFRADSVNSGFESSAAQITMKLINQHGQESTRKMRHLILEGISDGDKSIIIFDTPGDVRGTSVLTHTHKENPDDQWLYLPAIKRVKRIASNNKSGPFMGSEFAYEDLSSQEPEKYTYAYMREEDLEGNSTVVLERYPLDDASGYTRQVVWYNSDNYRIEKIEFYDRKNSLLKTLRYKSYTKYHDNFWRAGQMSMINHQSEKQTDLIFDDYQFRTGLGENDFRKEKLKRLR